MSGASDDHHRNKARKTAGGLIYSSGFGNEFATEALAVPCRTVVTPRGAPLGLYPEQLSGTAFTSPGAENQRSWLYRISPPRSQGRPINNDLLMALVDKTSAGDGAPTPERLRWDPFAVSQESPGPSSMA